MAKTLNILFVCGAGLGSSFAAQMAAEDVLNRHHINAKLDHVDISTAASVSPDIIITAQNLKTICNNLKLMKKRHSVNFLKKYCF